MRTDQYIGLSSRAIEFLGRAKAKKYVELEGAFGSIFPLLCFKLKGKEYHEIEQCSPWSSGPMFFLTLKEQRDLDWTADEIEEAVGERPYEQEDLDEMRKNDMT